MLSWQFVSAPNVPNIYSSENAYIIASLAGGAWARVSGALTCAVTTAVTRIDYKNGLMIAITDNYVYSSPDGTTWTQQAGLVTSSAGSGGVPYGAGLYVIPDYAGGANGTMKVWTSPDLVTWTSRTIATAAFVGPTTDVIYAPGIGFVAGSETGFLSTSADGITWSAHARPAGWIPGNTGGVVSLRAGNGLVVAVYGGTPYLFQSADGATWASCPIPVVGVLQTPNTADYISGQWIIGCNYDVIITSPDLAVFTKIEPAITPADNYAYWNCSLIGSTYYMGSGFSSSTFNGSATSPNTVAWTRLATGLSGDKFYGSAGFVAGP